MAAGVVGGVGVATAKVNGGTPDTCDSLAGESANVLDELADAAIAVAAAE